MFQKIETQLGPELLVPGTVVIYYPVREKGVTDINLSDRKDFMLYIVTAVQEEIVTLQLADETFSHAAEENENKHIIKFFNEMIEEGKWWTRLTF